MKRKLAAALTGSAVVASLTMTTPALAQRPQPGPPQLSPVAGHLVSPLSLAIAGNGTIYTTQNFIGELDRVGANGNVTPLYTSQDGSEVGGVSVQGQTVTFTLTGPKTAVMQREARGKITTLADVGTYEATQNPDGNVTYGIPNLSESCASQFPTGEDAPPPSYTGIVDSHPYATTSARGNVYVADAAGNTILSIDHRGHIRTLAVLPPRPIHITAQLAGANGLPDCAVGSDYLFEPVPTDVEMGPDGWLYVSSLPGGPEDASLGARGAVFKVNPRTGQTVQVATGLLGATDLAVTQHGDIYVTELFGDRISVIKKGSNKATTWADTMMPGAVETTSCSLYAATGVLADGMIVKAPLKAVPCGH